MSRPKVRTFNDGTGDGLYEYMTTAQRRAHNRTARANDARDAARWRYAEKHLRIGTIHYDRMAECHCEFDDVPASFIDTALAKGNA